LVGVRWWCLVGAAAVQLEFSLFILLYFVGMFVVTAIFAIVENCLSVTYCFCFDASRLLTVTVSIIFYRKL